MMPGLVLTVAVATCRYSDCGDRCCTIKLHDMLINAVGTTGLHGDRNYTHHQPSPQKIVPKVPMMMGITLSSIFQSFLISLTSLDGLDICPPYLAPFRRFLCLRALQCLLGVHALLLFLSATTMSGRRCSIT